MKVIEVKRKTKFENRYSHKMGRLIARVTSIKLFLFGVIPIKTLHRYRSTYYGKVKSDNECRLDK